jgi:hypothetical protein
MSPNIEANSISPSPYNFAPIIPQGLPSHSSEQNKPLYEFRMLDFGWPMGPYSNFD